MKKSVISLFGLILLVTGAMAILSGCSQGYSAGTSPAPVKPTAITQPAQTTSAPTATPASTGPTSKSTKAYKPVTFKPTVSGTTVTLPVAEVANAGNGNFFLNNMSFMAYQLDGKYFVRADVCVPCGSRVFTLQKGTLICGACGTVFSATTGIGMSGASACMTYAKKPVAFTTDGGNIVMTIADLNTAYQNTLNRKN